MFIIVATDYFTKLVKAQPLVNMTRADVIRFIKTQIIYRFRVPETITMDRALCSLGKK